MISGFQFLSGLFLKCKTVRGWIKPDNEPADPADDWSEKFTVDNANSPNNQTEDPENDHQETSEYAKNRKNQAFGFQCRFAAADGPCPEVSAQPCPDDQYRRKRDENQCQHNKERLFDHAPDEPEDLQKKIRNDLITIVYNTLWHENENAQ